MECESKKFHGAGIMSRIKLATAAAAAILVTTPMAKAAPFEFAGF